MNLKRYLQWAGSTLFLTLVCVFVAGCDETAKKQNTVGLYVDATELSQNDRQSEAIAKLKKAIEHDPEFALAYSMLGNIYLQQNNYAESTAALEKAIELNPWSIEDFQNLGKAYRAMGDFTSAANAYAKACEIAPTDPDVHLSAAEVYYRMEDYEQALEFIQVANDLAPADADVQKLMGDIYTAGKDDEMAIESYKRAIEQKGDDPAIMLPMAVSYLRSGQFDAAYKLLNDVVAIDPNNAEAWRHLGFTSLRLKDVDSAINNYLKAVSLEPGDYKNSKGLGVAYMMKYRQLEDTDPQAEDYKKKALTQWKRSLDSNPTQSKLLGLYRKYTR